MHYAKILIPVTLIAVAGTATSFGCASKASEPDTPTLSTRQAVNPPGNNGTVKIEEAGATDEIPENDPHVGCKFTIEFRGFDQGDLNATWTLSGQPPSGTAQIAMGTVFIGGDPAGGANDLDGVVNIDVGSLDLSGLTAQPQQGFHLKLEVHAEGSQGADTKFKVFWVQGCIPDGGTSSGGTSSGGTSSGGTSSGGTSSGGTSSGGTSSGGTSSGQTW
jgi:hypothetical protein